MMRVATARLMWKTLAVASVLAIVTGFELRNRREQDAEVRPRRVVAAASLALRSPEFRKRLFNHDDADKDRLIEALSLLAQGTSLSPAERKALEAECRRLREKSPVSPDLDRSGP
jgi:hypothetical protein